jgi:hypothetical protein
LEKDNVTTQVDRAVDYALKLEAFRATLEAANLKGGAPKGDTVAIETGRKFDKVYIQTPAQKMGRYMVDRNSWTIYGIKSWAQVNPRRVYGTLDTVSQFDWSTFYASPIAGTQAAVEHAAREATIAAGYAQRGRPRKTLKKK